jgi:hypothetical protein
MPRSRARASTIGDLRALMMAVITPVFCSSWMPRPSRTLKVLVISPSGP